MDKLNPATDGSSMDIVQANIEQLKTLFPDVFTEGKIDFDQLKSTLGDYVENNEERYSFNWHGKSAAKRIAQAPSTGTLRPCIEESKDWDTTQNLFIEGDNLEALKLLQKSYHKQVKMIYIDPPYNTGKEFIYPDNYKDNLDTYLEYSGQKDSEGRKFGTNTETTGRYHTNWLNMMYPRLKLARNLLRDDGVIFISIDDNEQSNLKKLCDEIFGEENFVSTIIWEKKFAPQNDDKYITATHDYILIYARELNSVVINLLPRSESALKKFKNPDNDPRGIWTSGDLTSKTKAAGHSYPIVAPGGATHYPPAGRQWAPSLETFNKWLNESRIWYGEKGNNVPRVKQFLSEIQDGLVPMSMWKHEDVGHNQSATQELKKLFDGYSFFDSPKPSSLLCRVSYLTSANNDTILDFFSGSATTAHAVMKLNAKDSGNRRHIMVQLPEPCDEKSEAYKAGYKTIADVGKERIHLAGEKIKAENTDKVGIDKLDIGFKVFKLDSSNIKPWDADLDNLDTSLFDAVDNIKEDRTEEDVLYELLLKYGIDLTVPIEQREIAGKNVYSIGFGALVVCLADEITLDVVEGIGKLKQELEPELMHVVFKDGGFNGDDVIKTNAIQILKRYDIIDVKTL